jgi:hypothetical protein
MIEILVWIVALCLSLFWLIRPTQLGIAVEWMARLTWESILWKLRVRR